MITFGFSAFLKLVSQSERVQGRAVRQRLQPSSGDAYDFHRSFRQLAHRYLVNGEPLAGLLLSAQGIKRPAERQSATDALERLAEWREELSGDLVDVPSVIYESPGHFFRVKFEPDFGVRQRGQTIAIHLWNTKKPPLALGPVYAALTLVASVFHTHDNPPGDVGVLSVREPPRLYQLSDVGDQERAAQAIIDRLEDYFRADASPPASKEERPRFH